MYVPLDDLLQNDVEETVNEENAEIRNLGYKKLARHYLADETLTQSKNAKLTAAAYHRDTRILVVGFNNGSFYIYEMPDVNLIHSLRYI